MINSTDVSKLFWAKYLTQIKSGVPVYFNFSEQLVSDLLFNEYDFKTRGDAFEEYLKIVRGLINVSGNKVAIKPEVYRNDNGYTSVIVLISIQIVAAERMTSLHNKYTNESYYPPLRKLLSSELRDDHDIPFVIDEYQYLWKSFRDEILAINKDSAITFDLVGKGREKNRIYPLSQALLNEKDLISLGIAFLNQKRIFVISETFNWSSFFSSMARRVSEKGRRCLFNISLRDEVVKQFNAFMTSRSLDELIDLDVRIKKDETSFQGILIEDETEAFFGGEEEFFLKILSQEGGELEENVGFERLRKFIQNRKYAVFHSYEGILKLNPRSRYVENVENICILSKTDIGIKFLEETVRVRDILFEVVEVQNCNEFNLFFIRDDRLSRLDLNIVNGNFGSIEKVSKLSFEGGLRISSLGNDYFVDFPPEKLLIDNDELCDTDIIEVNNKEMIYLDFKALLSMNLAQRLKITFRERGIVLNLISHEARENLLGHRISGREVSILKEVVTESERCIVGCKARNVRGVVQVTREDFVSFFARSKEALTRVEGEFYEALLESIELTEKLGRSHKAFMKIFVRTQMQAPVRLYSKLKLAS